MYAASISFIEDRKLALSSNLASCIFFCVSSWSGRPVCDGRQPRKTCCPSPPLESDLGDGRDPNDNPCMVFKGTTFKVKVQSIRTRERIPPNIRGLSMKARSTSMLSSRSRSDSLEASDGNRRQGVNTMARLLLVIRFSAHLTREHVGWKVIVSGTVYQIDSLKR